MTSPRSLGFRMPAEWEPQEAVWLSWPVNRTTWPDCWEEVQNTFAEMALKFSQHQSVFINLVKDEQSQAENRICSVGQGMGLKQGRLQFFDHPTDDAWVRDYGPIYVKHVNTGEIALTEWQFNAWGGKYPYSRDNRIPSLIAEATQLQKFSHSLVLEGGSIETNGAGDLLVTKDCLLNPNRNPGLGKEQTETALMEFLGIAKVHWLDGCLEGDDTDGHIDNLVRFFKTDGVLVAAPASNDDRQYAMLANLEQQCRHLGLIDGRKLDVVLLPLPEARYVGNKRLPMSYLNFFIGNETVFVPSYGQPGPDSVARATLAASFPGREVVPVDCRGLIREGGALHCLTQQVPGSL